MEYKKLDTAKPYIIRSKFFKGSIGLGILSICLAVAFSVYMALGVSDIASIRSSPVDILVFTAAVILNGIPFLVLGILLIAFYTRFQAITEDILVKGLITAGKINKIEFGIIFYVYTDNNGVIHSDCFKCRSGQFQQNMEIAVIFYDGLSLVLESYCEKQ